MPNASLLLLLLIFSIAASTTTAALSQTTYLLPSDAVALLSFKSKADLNNKLLFNLNEPYDYCQWQGIKCAQGRVVRVQLQSYSLRGTFPPYTLSRLGQLRVLSLHNNSLTGPVPDLSSLYNLKSLFLGRNSFSGSFPPSILLLHRLNVLDLSFNNFTGSIPVRLSSLDRLSSLQLQFNQFNDTLPPLNQSLLVFFNVSGNNLTGPIPLTPTLSKFHTSSFSLNPDLCGEIINKACNKLRSPFFDSSNATSAASPLSQSATGIVILSPPSSSPVKHRRKATVILGFIIGAALLVLFLLCLLCILLRKQKKQTQIDSNDSKQPQQISQNEEPDGAEMLPKRVAKSGALIFCATEKREMYTLEQLMRASAELLGRGTIGTTYKAVLDNQLIVTVKRLDATKTAITSGYAFDVHMGAIGELKHPNLVPLMAYFQAKGERLVIFDYQPNGSLYNLVHGSRSTRAKPLHWTSCLKIAEDVAQGLAYIHQSSKLVHGNLKSSNVLLGPDFEACITDYCLAILADTSAIEDPDSTACKAPETRKSSRRSTAKSDVYAFGVLLLELLTGKHPSHHPFLAPADMLDWVRQVREGDGAEDNQLGMLTEVASVCSLTSPEQRPAMWQVLKMIHEIKESVTVEDNAAQGYS
ncbi:probable inactive receptor kinase At5g67200 [Mercurialis annua]|uniref:probable inactive receptor kinase At5g67200 n=1 Tax=Mercurialis annua TaxID=3986 RepID=UPI00215FA8F8|nr:probable inactive receptor kinase At5g67200 [Mercurialis annua]XP_050205416.1 probable inactive receptor kinase At5g67200 [Mercurialis annua]XP_050205417.1 probable inactive receptor kinase At5g67200 [Mercurialis annua]